MVSEDRFCPRCSASLALKMVEGTQRPVCPRCGKVIYHDPKVSAVAVVEQDGKVLMVRRALEPGLGMWSLPGGYVDRGEVVERAAEREVEEETGLLIKVTRLLEVSSESGHHVILISYDSCMVGGELKAGPEVTDVCFFDLKELPPLAFPRDKKLLDLWEQSRNGHGSTSSP